MLTTVGRVIGVLGALALWWWGMNHWNLDYGVGFWAWVASLALLWVVFRIGPRLDRWLCLLLLTWLAMSALRFYRVDWPPDPGRETVGPVIDLDIVQGLAAGTYPNVFTTNWGVYIGPNYLATLLVPDYFVAFRYTAALWGALSLGAMLLLAGQLGDRRVALVALVLVGLSWWHNALGRILPVLSAPCGVALTWWAIVRACDRQSSADAALAGIIAALTVRLYESGKILIIVIPLWWLWHACVTSGFARRTWWCLGLSVAVMFLAIWPMLVHGGTVFFFQREHQVMFGGAEVQGGFLENPFSHVARQLRVVTGGADMLVNSPVPDPLLNPIEVALMLLGLYAACRRWRDPHATVAPIWLGATCLAVALSSVPEAGRRLAVALPAIGLLGGVGVTALLDGHPLLRRTAPLWLAVLVAVDLYWNLTFFTRWARAVGHLPS